MESKEPINPEAEHHLLSDVRKDDSSLAQTSISTIPVVPQLSVALGLLVFVFGVTYFGATHSLNKQADEQPLKIEPVADARVASPTFGSETDGIKLEAKAAIVWDVREGKILYEKNKDLPLPLASITKLMTALLTYELLDPMGKVSITQNALIVEGDSGFIEGEVFTVQDLADLTLISSSNDGAAALSTMGGITISGEGSPEDVFVTAMNIRAEELGLKKTSFKNSTGLDVSETEAGAYGSAQDVALLMEHILKSVPDAVALTNVELATIQNEEGGYHLVKNTNEDVARIDGLIASKTGTTDLSGGNLVVGFNAGLNRPIVVAVLGSSVEGRFTNTMKLIEATRTYMSGTE